MSISQKLILTSLLLSMVVSGAVIASAKMPEEVKTAIESGDYETFAELTAETGHFEAITEENFSQLQEAHELMQSGDRQAAKEIFDSLGLKGPRSGHQGPPAEVREAIESGDYATFVALHEENDREVNITEDQFAVLVQAHELHEAGDHDGAKELLESAGIERPERQKGRNGERPERRMRGMQQVQSQE